MHTPGEIGEAAQELLHVLDQHAALRKSDGPRPKTPTPKPRLSQGPPARGPCEVLSLCRSARDLLRISQIGDPRRHLFTHLRIRAARLGVHILSEPYSTRTTHTLRVDGAGGKRPRTKPVRGQAAPTTLETAQGSAYAARILALYQIRHRF